MFTANFSIEEESRDLARSNNEVIGSNLSFACDALVVTEAQSALAR